MIATLLILSALGFAPPTVTPELPKPVTPELPTRPNLDADSVMPKRPPSRPLGPAVPVTRETQSLEAPVPTVSPAFGNVLAFAGDRLIISGAVIARFTGANGQIFTFALKDGKWTSISDLVQMQAMQADEFALQRILGDPEFLLTNIARKSASSEIVTFAPAEGREAWKPSGSIRAPASEKSVNFASAMALSGATLAVGEVSSRPNMKDEEYSENPRVFIFSRTPAGWKAEGAIRRGAERKPWWFGIALAMDGDTLAVGNPMSLMPYTTEKARSSQESAMVCVYRKGADGWKLEQEIENFGLSPWQGFGVNLALQGDLLVVRSINPFNKDDAIDVVALRRVGGKWVSDGLLNPGAGVTKGRGYGFTLAIDQGRIIVGDGTAVEGDDKSGRVYVFERGAEGWDEKWRLGPKVFVSPNSFGNAIAVRWPWVAVGRIRNERLGIEPGGALLYKLDASPSAAAGSAPPSPAAK